MLSLVHVGLGNFLEALATLEEAKQERAADLIWLAVKPAFDPLRGKESFEALQRAVGLRPMSPLDRQLEQSTIQV